ncbi:VOC family protein [Duganella sp. CY15W]|uniref:VOC family protein n=1 Tax=Duganella sp. CY15W TaxID=2692172 RepID=UPI0019260733|nr:VOC family protein [Duganella sp. CY15W]
MTLSILGQIALPVTSTDRAEQFYGDMLGLPKLFRYGDLAFFNCGGVRLMLDGGRDKVDAGTGVCHYFKVEHIDTVAATLQARGVAFEREPHLVAKMPDHALWMAFFRDPDGHLLALMEEKR